MKPLKVKHLGASRLLPSKRSEEPNVSNVRGQHRKSHWLPTGLGLAGARFGHTKEEPRYAFGGHYFRDAFVHGHPPLSTGTAKLMIRIPMLATDIGGIRFWGYWTLSNRICVMVQMIYHLE